MLLEIRKIEKWVNFELKNKGPRDGENVEIEINQINNNHQALEENNSSITDTEVRKGNLDKKIKRWTVGESINFHLNVKNIEGLESSLLAIRQNEDTRWFRIFIHLINLRKAKKLCES